MSFLRKQMQTPSTKPLRIVRPKPSSFSVETEAVDQLKEGRLLAVSLETTSPEPRKGKPRLLILSTDRRPQPLTVNLKNVGPKTWSTIATLLTGNKIKVAYDWIEVEALLRTVGLRVSGPLFDLKIAGMLLKAGIGKRPPDLTSMAGPLLGVDPDQLERTFNWSGPLTLSQRLRAEKRAAVLLPLREKLLELIEPRDLMEVTALEFKCLPAVMEMCRNGMRIDTLRLQALLDRLEERAAAYRQALLPWFPPEVNMNSSPQVKAALAGKGINLDRVDRESLMALEGHRDLTESLIGYRSVSHQIRSYARKFLEAVDPSTSRVYPLWHQLGAATGRFSCSNPPLQGVPKTAEFRSCFVPDEGHVFVIADLSQIELRVAAEYSGDDRMIRAFQEKQDFHRLTASLLTEKPLRKVTQEERHEAKALNFGLIYGMGDEGLRNYARTKYGVELTRSEAKSFRLAFFEAYPQLASWIEDQATNESGESRTLSCRRRRWVNNSATEMELINAPIQGTAADILKKALGQLPAALASYQARIIACAHDEIILEVRREEAQPIAKILKSVMEEAGDCYLYEVPTVAKVRISSSWGEE